MHKPGLILIYGGIEFLELFSVIPTLFRVINLSALLSFYASTENCFHSVLVDRERDSDLSTSAVFLLF